MKREIAIVAAVGLVLISIEIVVLVLCAMLMMTVSQKDAGLLSHVFAVSMCIAFWNFSKTGMDAVLKLLKKRLGIE